MLKKVCIRRWLPIAMMVGVLAGCGKQVPLTPETAAEQQYVVAEFDPDYTMSAKDLYATMYGSTFMRRGGVATDSAISDFLDSVLIDTLAGLAGCDYPLESKWSQYREFKDRVDDEMLRIFWEIQVGTLVTVDSQEVRQFYADHADVFHIPEQVDLYHILCSPDAFRFGPDSNRVQGMSKLQLWREAEEYCFNLHQLLNYGMEFQNAAYRYSHDIDSRAAGGHLGWTRRGVYPDPFDSIAFGLEPGEFSEPYRDAGGWHLVFIDGKYSEGAIPIDSPGVFEAVRATLITDRSNRRSAAVYDSLLSLMTIEYLESRMTADLYGLEDSSCLAVVNGEDTVDVRRISGSEEPLLLEAGLSGPDAEIRKRVINEVAKRFAIIKAARDIGIDTVQSFIQWRNDLRRVKSKGLIMISPEDPTWEPTPEAVKAYYDAHFEEYNPPRPVTVRCVTVADSGTAEFLLEQLRTGLELEDLQERFGAELGLEFKIKDLGAIGKDYPEGNIFIRAMATPKGDFTVARSDKGWHVMETLERVSSRALSMTEGEIRGYLKGQHYRERWHALRDSLYSEYNVRFPNRMKTVALPRLGDRLANPLPY